MTTRRTTVTLPALLALALASCGGPAETPAQKAAARVARAEAAMDACKERLRAPRRAEGGGRGEVG